MRSYSVLVTGASGGIGSAIARRFASHPTISFNVTLVGRKQSGSKLNELRHQLARNHQDQKHHVLLGKVWKPEFWRNIRGWQRHGDEITERGRREEADVDGMGDERADIESNRPGVEVPWVLVNAAGVARMGVYAQMEDEAMQEVLDVNLVGTMLACRAFGERRLIQARARRVRQEMDEAREYWRAENQIEKHSLGEASENERSKEPDFGLEMVTPSIVNVSSLLGTHGRIGTAVYAASKAGIIGLSRALAAEYGRMGTRVNTILPGYIDTQMTQAEPANMMDRARNSVPLKRLGTSEEVADAAMFLALNNYANNCMLNIDGGLSAVGVSDRG